MDITITITDLELSEIDKKLITECLGLSPGDLESGLKKICKTSFMEYCKMFKEKGIPTRADEVMQERLFYLLQYYYESHLPSENEISTIFQLTPSQSKTLLRNTKSRYRTKIASFIKNSLTEVIKQATLNNDTGQYYFICDSNILIEELNMMIGQEKKIAYELITRTKGTAIKYECSKDTYDLLKQKLKIK